MSPRAAWRPGDPVGGRRFGPGAPPGGLVLEAGGQLPSVEMAYETWGTPDRDGANAVLVLHALSGDSHAAGAAGPGHPVPGWWDALIGPGRPLDTDRFFVVCPNVLGGCQGTTGPSSAGPDGAPYGSRFPLITIRDQVAAEAVLAEHLGVARWFAVVGGSMGGMRALEWCVSRPAQVDRAVVLATGAAATAEQIALCSLQIRAIRLDPAFAGGDYYGGAAAPDAGMSVARGIGHLSYRTADELEARFGRHPQDAEDPLKGGRFAVESYLQHHGEKLPLRFDANSYVALSEAMNHHDVGRGRGGVAAALGQVTARVTVAGISSDRLYPLALQEQMARLLPGAHDLAVVDSLIGHDGFLVETAQVGAVVGRALA